MSNINNTNVLNTNNNHFQDPHLEMSGSSSYALNARRKKADNSGSAHAVSRTYKSVVWFVFGLLSMNTFFEIFARNIGLSSTLVQSKSRSRLSYLIPFLGLILLVNLPSLSAAGQEEPEAVPEAVPEVDPFSIPADEQPRTIRDPNLTLEEIVRGLYRPTAMAFLGNSSNDIIVSFKDNGTVNRIINGEVQPEPLIDVAVANNNDTNERGLLGLGVAKQNETTTYVFLYYTESGDGVDGSDSQGIVPVGNRLYRYELVQEADGAAKLINPKLLLDLPARPGPRYNGGPLLVSQNQGETTIYLMIGDLDHRTSQANNYEDGPPADGTGGILAVDVEGNPLPNPVLLSEISAEEENGDEENGDEENGDEENGDEENGDEDVGMLPYYFSYGLRNGFGMAFDPVTGYLWDTENGPDWFDEINLVLPGFNSGWAAVQGPASAPENEATDIDEDLVDFEGAGVYRDPEFAWQNTVGVTAINFINSTALGLEYQNDMLVGDVNHGRIYHFDLNQDRTGLMLGGMLEDKVADNVAELGSVIWGTGFSSITDIEIGPDGYVYILDYGPNGRIFKIAPPTAGQG